jgi:hypothetical protein
MEEGWGREERAALLEAVEADLARLLPDLEIVDRGLDLSRGPVRGAFSRRADLVAVDGSGRPLLVLLVDGRGDDTVLTAINALAFARQSGDAVARPAREALLRGAAARVALVAEAFSSRSLDGLSLLPERELLLFEARKIESGSGSRVRLVRQPLLPARAGNEAADRGGFLATVPEALRGTAELLLRRLARVDAAVECSFGEGTASFRCEGRELCSVEVREGGLFGAIPALERSLPIHGMDDADAFLDEVLREHILLLGEGWGAPPLAASTRVREPPLLTPEEIAAFRD